MASDFDSLFADDTPVTPQEQSWGGFDYWKLLENQPQQAPQQPMPPQQMPGIPAQPMMPGFPPMPQAPMWWMGWDNNMFISSQNDIKLPQVEEHLEMLWGIILELLLWLEFLW